jgi:hypothetical protein
MRLIYRGRMISDSESQMVVPEYKLEDGSVLHCMGKPVPRQEEERQQQAAMTQTVVVTTPSSAAVVAAASTTGSAVAPPGDLMVGPPLPSSVTSLSGSDTPSPAPTGNQLSVAEGLQHLRRNNPSEAYETGVKTLDKVLGNIIRHPMEEKYRMIKSGNPAFRSRLGGLRGADALMGACGFVRQLPEGSDEEHWVMQASAESWPVLLVNKAVVEAAASAGVADPGTSAVASSSFSASTVRAPAQSANNPADAFVQDPARFLSDPAMLQQAFQVRSFWDKANIAVPIPPPPPP